MKRLKPPPKESEEIERSFELERIIFFSDAVFAIAITLLAIELHVPDLGADQTNERLFAALLAQAGYFFAFTLSFVIVALYWIAHHRYFRYIIRYDGGLIGRNLLMLFFVALMPFTTLLVGEYGNLTGTIWLYAADLMGLGLGGAWLWYHASHNHRLVSAKLEDGFIRFMQLRAFATPAAAVIVILLSFVIGESASLGWFFIWLFQIMAHRRYKMYNP